MVQGSEWIVILLVALVVFGPERLPEISRKLGGWARELRNAAREMREGLETEVSEVQKAKSALKDPLKEVRQAVRDTARLAADANPTRLDWKGPKPLSGPTPADALADLDRIEQGQIPTDTPGAPEVESSKPPEDAIPEALETSVESDEPTTNDVKKPDESTEAPS